MEARTRSDANRNQQRVLQVLRQHPTGRISYDNLAAEVVMDRRTVISIVCYLRHRGHLSVTTGRGNTPNRYQVNDIQ